MPTKYGDISARWTSKDHRFTLHFTTPRNTSGTVAVPAGKHSIVLVDGRPVRPQITDGYAQLHLRGGSHTITVLR